MFILMQKIYLYKKLTGKIFFNKRSDYKNIYFRSRRLYLK